MIPAFAEPGPVAIGVVIFFLLAAWCFGHRRVDQSLAALGLYLGLLDGYLKLRTGSPTITLVRDVLVVAIAAGALFRSMRTKQPLALPPLGGLVIAFTGVVLVELLNPSGPPFANGLAGIRQHLEFVPLFFLGYAFLRQDTHLRKFLFILVFCAAVGGAVSYVQSTLTPQELAGWGAGYRDRVLGTGSFVGAPRVAFDAAGNTFVRPFGLGSDQGAGAMAAALALPSLIALLMGPRGALRLVAFPLSVGIALAVATSGSRAALVTVFVSAVAFGILATASKNALRVVAGLAVSVVLVYAAFQQLGADNNTRERAKSIAPTQLLSTFSKERGVSAGKFGEYAYQHPLGLGVGSIGPAASIGKAGAGRRQTEFAQRFNGETEWNFLVLETGLAGLTVFLALNLRLISLALTRIRRLEDPALRLYLAALAAPLFGLLAAGFAGPTTATVPTAPYLWLVSGVLSYWLVTRQFATQKS